MDLFKQALRSFRSRRAFAILAVVTLALAIGANAAIFSVVHAVLLRQLPYRDPDRLFALGIVRTDDDEEPLSIPDFLDYRAAGVLDGVAAYFEAGTNLTGDGDPERLFVARTGDGFFDVLGAVPALGRTFRPDERQAHVAVLSDGLWRRRFGADPGALGRTVVLNDESYTIVGVMAHEFIFPGARAELAAPIDLEQDQRRAKRDAGFLRVVARVGAPAQAALDAVAARLQRDFPEADGRKRAVRLTPMADELVGKFRAMLGLLLGAVGLVLLVACANLACLLLAAALRRRRELGIRAALGASRGRLVLQLLLESALVAAAGATLGLLLAGWGADLLIALSPAQIPRIRDAGVDGAVVGFTVAATVTTVLIVGLAPALQAARAAPLAGLIASSGARAGAGPGSTRTRRALVAAEVALSMALLAVAGLLVHSFARLGQVPPGFVPEHALTMRLMLPAQRYPDAAAVLRFEADLRARLAALPGVVEAGSIQALPLSGVLSTIDFTVEGRPPPRTTEVPQAHYRMVTPGLREALGIALVAGRDLGVTDGPDAPAVVLVNRRLAGRYLGDGVVGARLLLDDGGPRPRSTQVVGIVDDVRAAGLDREPDVQVYVPLAQVPTPTLSYGRNRFWIVRTAGAPLGIARAAVDAVHALDAAMPAAQVQSLEQVVAGSVAPRRFNLILVAAFAAAALLLSAIGIYALAAQLVAGRVRELGIRLALGARPGALVRFALLDALRPVLLGLALGVVGVILAGRLAAGLLFETSSADPAMLALAGCVLGGAALLAAWLPARHATRIDPQIALRTE